MEDFYFHQYHSSLFVVVKIIVMKRNTESTDSDRLRLSDSTVASRVKEELVCENSFLTLKISLTLFASV